MLSRSEPVSGLVAAHQASQKFVYRQGDKAQQALDESLAPSQGDNDVLFHLPVTENWLYQLILGLVLICHSSYQGVVELLRDLFDTPISMGTVSNSDDSGVSPNDSHPSTPPSSSSRRVFSKLSSLDAIK